MTGAPSNSSLLPSSDSRVYLAIGAAMQLTYLNSDGLDNGGHIWLMPYDGRKSQLRRTIEFGEWKLENILPTKPPRLKCFQIPIASPVFHKLSFDLDEDILLQILERQPRTAPLHVRRAAKHLAAVTKRPKRKDPKDLQRHFEYFHGNSLRVVSAKIKLVMALSKCKASKRQKVWHSVCATCPFPASKPVQVAISPVTFEFKY